jgi:hypothetical protein
MKHLLVLVMVSASLLANSQTAPPSGNIKGFVTDRNGDPISAATVYAVPQGLTLDDFTPRSVKTDGNGAFDFRGGFALEPYKLYARKDADAYPNPLDSFYADTKTEAPKVDLTKDHPSAAVTVRLGNKAGVIAGRVIDATTGTAVKAELGFLDGDGHGHSLLVDGNYRILVPPGKDVTLMVTLLGPPHDYDRAQVPVAPLRLEPGQYIYMDLPISTR